jgi:hypothetical protein
MTLPTGNGVQNPLNQILLVKSWLGLKELDYVVHYRKRVSPDTPVFQLTDQERFERRMLSRSRLREE